MNTLLFKISDVFNKEKIDISDVDEEKLFGQIVTNRMAGIAYNNINLDGVSPDIVKALKVLYESAKERTKAFKSNLEYLASLFKEATFKYAFLKGAVLTSTIYPEGYRTSNDIDMLVAEKDISAAQRILKEAGFIQGWIDNDGSIVKATRSEILMSRMNYGETVPFVKYNDQRPLTVDINFSLDYKPENEKQIVDSFLSDNTYLSIDNYGFYSLNRIDFLMHLCCHLYKEATTDDWVERKRDLQLYKFSDINVYLHKYGNTDYFVKLIERVKQLGMERECYYTLFNTAVIYPNVKLIDGYNALMDSIKPDDISFMKQIVFPQKKKILKYDMTFAEWFFCEDRISNLKEVL